MTSYELPGGRAWTDVYLHIGIIRFDTNGKNYRVTIVFDDVNIEIKNVNTLPCMSFLCKTLLPLWQHIWTQIVCYTMVWSHIII